MEILRMFGELFGGIRMRPTPRTCQWCDNTKDLDEIQMGAGISYWLCPSCRDKFYGKGKPK